MDHLQSLHEPITLFIGYAHVEKVAFAFKIWNESKGEEIRVIVYCRLLLLAAIIMNVIVKFNSLLTLLFHSSISLLLFTSPFHFLLYMFWSESHNITWVQKNRAEYRVDRVYISCPSIFVDIFYFLFLFKFPSSF